MFLAQTTRRLEKIQSMCRSRFLFQIWVLMLIVTVYRRKMKILIFNFVSILNFCIHAGELAKYSTVLKIDSNSTSRPCEWNDGCEIQCLNGEFLTDSYIGSIQSVYSEVCLYSFGSVI